MLRDIQHKHIYIRYLYLYFFLEPVCIFRPIRYQEIQILTSKWLQTRKKKLIPKIPHVETDRFLYLQKIFLHRRATGTLPRIEMEVVERGRVLPKIYLNWRAY